MGTSKRWSVFKGFAGNGKVGEFLFVAQWQFASSNDSAAYGDHYQWGRAKDGHAIGTVTG
jgi:hypothetical protein